MRTQFVTDNSGNKLAVILPIKEYNKMIDELEELEDIRLYDEAIKNDTGERVSMNEAFKMIEANRKTSK
jgi:hypothetical protein